MSLTKVKASNISLTTAAASSNDTTPATTQYVTTAINNLIDGAPATLNTLDEIAAALNDDAALNTTLTNAIAAKLPLAGGTMTGALTVNHAGGIVTKGGGGLHLQPTDAHDTDAWILYQYSDNTLRYNFTGAGADEIIIKHPASANTTTLTVDTAQIRVGIGTASPNTTLTLSDGTDKFDFGSLLRRVPPGKCSISSLGRSRRGVSGRSKSLPLGAWIGIGFGVAALEAVYTP